MESSLCLDCSDAAIGTENALVDEGETRIDAPESPEGFLKSDSEEWSGSGLRRRDSHGRQGSSNRHV